jgi:phosphate transport system substrate-binding protein
MNQPNREKEGALRSRLIWLATLIVAGLTLVLVAGCGDDNKGGGSDLSGSIKIDGSSTVGPLTEAAAELFREENPNVKITVGISGTGGGMEKFCAGEIDIADASRSIDPKEEVPVCKKNNIGYDEIQVANDGIAIVVNPDNDWAKCLTTAELKKIWEKGSTVNNWNQVRSGFPDESMKLFGPGTDSGTFDFFTEAINGEKGNSRSTYSPSEDDNVTVQGVAGGKGNSGYFGLSYAEENTDKVKLADVDGGDGCVTPSTETVQDGSYKPLSRPLFIYPSTAALKKPQVDAFVKYYVDNYEKIAEQAKFVPMTTEQADKAKSTADKVAGGT